jgi:hypothetical protein
MVESSRTIRAAVSAAIPRIKNVASELSLGPTFLKTLKLKKKLPFAHAGDSAVLILTRLLNKKVEIPYKTRSFEFKRCLTCTIHKAISYTY